MIFKQWRQVLDGSKTQTRRPVKEGEYLGGCDIPTTDGWVMVDAVYDKKRVAIHPKWLVQHQTYAVQSGRGKKAVGRIRITKIRRERLQDISEDDCEAEGVGLQRWATDIQGVWPWTAGFAQLWDSIYKKPYRWEDNCEVWVLEFELADEGEDDERKRN